MKGWLSFRSRMSAEAPIGGRRRSSGDSSSSPVHCGARLLLSSAEACSACAWTRRCSSAFLVGAQEAGREKKERGKDVRFQRAKVSFEVSFEKRRRCCGRIFRRNWARLAQREASFSLFFSFSETLVSLFLSL